MDSFDIKHDYINEYLCVIRIVYGGLIRFISNETWPRYENGEDGRKKERKKIQKQRICIPYWLKIRRTNAKTKYNTTKQGPKTTLARGQ